MNIVLVSSAGGGKDTVYDILSKHYGYNRYAFADNVKGLAEIYFPHLYNSEKKPRWLLQAIGTKMREIDPEVWIKAMLQEIDENRQIAKRHGYLDEFIAVTDCRLPNEYEALKKRGYIFIRITVDEEIRKQRMIERGDVFKDEDLKHHTESYYDTFECDYEVSNNGTIEELKGELDIVMKKLMERK